MKEENLSDKELRKIYINEPELNFFCNNTVRTAKYNIFTFLPLAVFYQFNNYFNIFFLLTAIILSIKVISPMDPAVAIFPFIFVISVSIVREAIEDYKKAQFDKNYNNSKVKYVNEEGKEVIIKWSEVRVGNIIKIEKNDIIAADVLILKTSDKSNIAFMQTTNLDGENSLKQKEGMSVLSSLLERNERKINLLKGLIEIEQPNSNIYKTHGIVEVDSQKYIFTNDNILLRAATLKNTDFVFGIVVYTGKDTKTMNNSNQTFSIKISSIERTLNKVIIAVIIVVLSICVACTVFGMIFMGANAPNINTHEMKAEYIYYSQNNENSYTLEFFKLFGSFFIIFNNIIPISLTITFEIAKGIQVYRMELDKKMKNENENENFKVLSLKIQEDLGNVRYIFTDKTGTLTKNELEFKACSVINRLFFTESKNQPSSENPKIVIEGNQNNVNNNLINENYANKANNQNQICSKNNHHNEEKLKKSMFASDFPLLSLRQALEMDYPINFNIETEVDNLIRNEGEHTHTKFKRETSIFDRNKYKIGNAEDNQNQNCVLEYDEAEEMDNSYNLNLNIRRLFNVRNDYIPEVNNKENSRTNFEHENENENSNIKSQSSESLKSEPTPTASIAPNNQLNLILKKNQTLKNIRKQKTMQSELDNISNASIKLLQKQQQTSKLFNFHRNRTSSLNNQNHWDSSKELIKELFLNIALNHNVMLNREESQLSYQGPNPDEVALATCAYEVGVKFLEKDSNTNTLKLELFGELFEYEVLFKIPFESARKRSTIVVREIKRNENKNLINVNDIEDDPNQVVKIFIKGADNVIFDLIDENSKKFVLPTTKEHLDSFAKGGLRTLCYSVKYINFEDFQNWKANYNQLINNPSNATLSQTESEIENLVKELEKNSILLGVTGLEDKLQNEVKETINDFIEARIHMWMLTGDNIDTAESIGHSSRIFNDDTEVFKLKASESKEDLKAKLQNILKELENMEKEILRLKLERKKRNKKSKSNSNKANSNVNGNNEKKENLNKNLNAVEDTNIAANRTGNSLSDKKNTNGKIIFARKKMRSSNNLIHSFTNNKVRNDLNLIENLHLEGNFIKENLEGEKYKNNSDDEFSKIKNNKYSNDIFDKNLINPQACSTLKKLESLNIYERTQKNISKESNEEQDKVININNFMNHSHHDFSYFRIKNKNNENPIKIVQDLEASKSETISDDVDELSVIRFMLERNFFDNSGNKLVGNMTFLNKIIEMSKDISLNRNHSKQDLKQNLKQVVEYLIENNNQIIKDPNTENAFKLKKLSEKNIYNKNNTAYNINIIQASESDDHIEKHMKLDNKTFHNQAHNHSLELDLDKSTNNPKLLNEQIHRINTLNLNMNKTERNYKPSTSPLKTYKNIENKQKNIVDLVNNLKKLEDSSNGKDNNNEKLSHQVSPKGNDNSNNNESNNNEVKLPEEIQPLNLLNNENNNKKNSFLDIQQKNEKNELNLLRQSLKAESNCSVKSDEDAIRSTKNIDLSTIYEYYQKELNKFKARKENVKKILKFTNFNFKDMKEKKPVEDLEEIPEIDLLNFGLIIEGDAITHCLDPELALVFWKLIKKSRSVICCRCNPIQKSQIVNFVKGKSSEICLAIGDGGNDVNMIKAANVGIGIFGKEGYQAAYSSDYAISEFRYLRRLLFYHGRYFLLRNSYFIYFFFYKSLIFNVPNLWFAFFSGFSGTLLWDSIYFLLYTSILTTMPPVVPMIFDEDIDIEMKKYPNKEILKNLIPDIYKETRDSSPFNSLKFLFVFIMGCLHSAVIYFFPLFIFGMGNQDYLGRSQSIWDHSLVGIITILIVQYYILFQDTYLFSFPVVVAHGVQITVNVVFFNVYACFGSDELGLYTYDVISNFKFWFSFLLILFISLIPVIISRKVDFFLSQNIVNNLRNRNFEDDYTRKICIKKIEQMHKCSRSLAKFRKIYTANRKNNKLNIQNLADKKMKEIVDQYKQNKKLNKIQNNSNLILNENANNKNNNNNNINKNLIDKQNNDIRNFEPIEDNEDAKFQKAKTTEFNKGQIIQILVSNKNKSKFNQIKKKNDKEY